jgi:hypothetical protein
MNAAFLITAITAQGTNVFTMGTSMKIIWPTSHGLEATNSTTSLLSPHAALVTLLSLSRPIKQLIVNKKFQVS